VTDTLFPRVASPDDTEAVRIGADALTYEELARSAAAVASSLTGDERVAVWTTHSLETCVAVVGALAAGVAVVPLNPRAGTVELAHIVGDSKPSCVLAPAGAELPAAIAGIVRRTVGVREKTSGSLPDLLAPEATALVLYTSGTTGPPKGVQLPRSALESNLDALAAVWEWSADDRLAHALPLYHVHGLALGLIGPLRRGGQLELVPGFTPEALAEALDRNATLVFGVPTMYHRIGLEAERDPALARSYSRPRLLVSGSAALRTPDAERFRRVTGQAIVQRYGMTETMINLAVAATDPFRPGYAGRPVPGVEVVLVDDNGTPLEVEDDTTFGEVVVRGPNLFTGYLNDPAATAAAMRDGWFFTGDLATRTADCLFRIVGRKATDLIKSGGFRIGAGEIEDALLLHRAIAEAAVFGIEDADLGERIGAWVVLRPGSYTTVDELRSHVGEHLAPHKRPHTIRFVDELPRNALGKIVKGQIVRHSREGALEPES
jgi:malonyl-CoA/methylmalonyl-CoA synthetase